MRRLFVVGVLAATLLHGCSVNPVTGKRQLDLIGEAQEVELGKSIYPQAIQGSFGPIEDATTQDEVHRLGAALAAVGHRPNLPYEFTAVNEPEANAFALPGGKICITRGLLGRLESEDGAAAVLAHEIGHVTARHAVSQYNRQLLATALPRRGRHRVRQAIPIPIIPLPGPASPTARPSNRDRRHSRPPQPAQQRPPSAAPSARRCRRSGSRS